MSTPTPTQPAQPGSASKKTTTFASTPSHLGGSISSPAPRSVPSPAATRKDQAGKTPNTQGPTTHGSRTIGAGTPMVRNPSQTGVSSSPGALIGGANFGTPLTGLGVDLGGPVTGGTPGQMNLATPLGAGPMAMLPSLSQFSNMDITGGVGGGLGRRNEDEERRAKMHKVLKTIGRARSRVSEEGIARVSRRLGLQNDIDSENLSAAERQRRAGNRTIGIAGKTILIDVELKQHIAQNVSVMLSGEGKALEEQGEAAGRILLQDLAARESILLQTPLDTFAANLSYLAHLDQFSDKVNCFEAMSGIYTSLRRLYDLEVKAARAESPDGKTAAASKRTVEDRAEADVVRKRNGKPTMHEHRELGVAIEYWRDEICHTTTNNDPSPSINGALQDSGPETNLHVLRLDIRSSTISLMPSIRLSDTWLPEQFELPDHLSGDQLPWQEPSASYLSGGSDSMDIDTNRKPPDLHFVAKLDPPIIVPLPVAATIFTALGASQSAFPYSTYQAMLLDIPANDNFASEISAQQTVFAREDGKEIEIYHQYTLDVPKPDYGFKLQELPFSHPRQLVELLPLLRQWAFLGILLRSAFGKHDTGKAAKTVSDAAIVKDAKASRSNMDLNDALHVPSKQQFMHGELDIEISLLTSPSPSLSIVYVEARTHKRRNIDLQVLPNGEIVISDLAGSSEASIAEPADSSIAAKLARALTLCGDLGVWIEWLRKN